MVLKIMGLLDLLSIAALLLFKYGLISRTLLIVAAVYLMVKGAFFFRNIASIVDFGVAVIFILAIFGIYNVLTWIAIVWILQKAILSLFS